MISPPIALTLVAAFTLGAVLVARALSDIRPSSRYCQFSPLPAQHRTHEIKKAVTVIYQSDGSSWIASFDDDRSDDYGVGATKSEATNDLFLVAQDCMAQFDFMESMGQELPAHLARERSFYLDHFRRVR